MIKKLNNNEELYLDFIENASDLIQCVDASGKFVYVNKTWLDKLEYTANEVENILLWDIIHSDSAEHCQKTFSKVMKGENVGYVEAAFVSRTGKKIDVEGNINCKFDSDGGIISTRAIFRDVSNHKRMEKLALKNKHFLNTVLGSIKEGVAVINEDYSIEYMNDTIKKWNTSCTNDKQCYKLLKRIDSVCEDCIMKACLATGKPQFQQKKIQTCIGERWIEVHCYPLKEEDSAQRKVVEFMRDITDRKEIEESLFHEKEQFRTTLLSVGDGVISVDTNKNIVVMNKVAEELTGYTIQEAEGMPFSDIFEVLDENTKQKCPNSVEKVIATGKTVEIASNVILVSKEGYEIQIEKTTSPIKDKDGNITGAVLVFRDFTEKKEKQNEILYLSYHDQLTKLYNRRYFEEEIKRVDKEENYPLTIVMLDVNGLKLINDAFGHLVGDEFLQAIAEMLTKNTREKDTIARIGGDEFIIIMPSTEDDELKSIMKQIGEEISSKRLYGMNLSVSYGWATKTDNTTDSMDTFKKAEDYMYRRKLSESQSMRHSAVDVILKTLYEKNPREEMHSKRVSELCVKIGKAIGLGKEEINEMRTAGLMHDIGKIVIPDDVLNKSGELTNSEWITMKRHPETGYKILSSVHEFAPLAKEVLQHHERWDGKGYPAGLKGEEIEVKARVIAIADSYDAMTSDRPYRKGITKREAIEEIKQHSGTQFDPYIASVFVKLIENK